MCFIPLSPLSCGQIPAFCIVHLLTRCCDRVYIDADKRSNLAYLRKVIGEDGPPIISPGGLIVVDNTLWKGLVLHKV